LSSGQSSELSLELTSKQSSERSVLKRAASIFKLLLPLDGLLDPYELFKRILDTTEYADILLHLPNGSKKIRNLEKLTQIIDEFSRKHSYTARDLPVYLDTLQESGGMDSEAFLDNEDSEAVKILTIHASKGLEFPVVFLPSIDRAVDTIGKRVKPLMILHPDYGICAIGVNDEGKLSTEQNTNYANIHNERLYRELTESHRVFYVALTRAENHLVMIGENQAAKKGNLMDQNSFMKMLSWVFKEYGVPKPMLWVDAISYLQNLPLDLPLDLPLGLPLDLPLGLPHDLALGLPLDLPCDLPLDLPRDLSLELPRDLPLDLALDLPLDLPLGLPLEQNELNVQYGSGVSRTDTAKRTNNVYDVCSLPPHQPSGLVSVSQWMSWQECPRQYWFQRIMRMPPEVEVELYAEMESTGSDETGLVEESLISDEIVEGEVPGIKIDAARLGTWIHEQLQNIPIDCSGPVPVPGLCEPQGIIIPEWMKGNERRVIKLLEGYNKISKDSVYYMNHDANVGSAPSLGSAPFPSYTQGLESDPVSGTNQGAGFTQTEFRNYNEKLIHSWNEFEFQIKVDNSLTVVGIIDRLDIIETDDGLKAVLIDYKSNVIQNEERMMHFADHYAIQLQVYAWAISQMPVWHGEKLDVLRCELYFLDAAKSVQVPIGSAGQKTAVDSLSRALPDLLGVKDMSCYPLKTGIACSWCQYTKICRMVHELSNTDE